MEATGLVGAALIGDAFGIADLAVAVLAVAAFTGVGLVGADFVGATLAGAAFVVACLSGSGFLTAGFNFCAAGFAGLAVGFTAFAGLAFTGTFFTAVLTAPFDRDAGAPTDFAGFFGFTEDTAADFMRVLDLALGLAGEFRKLNLGSQFNLVQYLGQLWIVGPFTTATHGLRQLQ